MKRTRFPIALLTTVSVAQAVTVASISGPDGGGELVSIDRFVSFGWISADPHFEVSISARLAALSSGLFEGTAYLTFGPDQFLGEIAHTSFVVTSQTPVDVLLFDNVALPPNNYHLTLAADSPTAGLWVVAFPVAFLNTSPDTGIGGGDGVSTGGLVNQQYPPASVFTSGGRETKFSVTEAPEPSRALLVGAGAIGFWIFRRRLPNR